MNKTASRDRVMHAKRSPDSNFVLCRTHLATFSVSPRRAAEQGIEVTCERCRASHDWPKFQSLVARWKRA